MKKRLIKIKRVFILFQMIILLSALVGFIFIVTSGYVKTSQERIKNNLNDVMYLIIEQIGENTDIPGKGIGSSLFFIIDQKDGSYIVGMNDELDQTNTIWEQYRTKLTYQMQKQKSGWISYPVKTSGQYFKDSRIIRYSTIKELGWIVVVEDFLPSEWSLAQNILNKNNLANLLVIIFLGFVISKIITDNYFIKMEKQMSDSSSDSFLDFNQAIVKKSSLKSEFKEKTSEKSIELDVNEMNAKPETKPMVISVEDSLEVKLSQKPDVQEEIIVRNKMKPEIKSEPIKPLARNGKEIMEPYIDDVVKENYSFKPQESSDRWTVSEQGIKSPILKKLLKELREQKEKI